MERIRKRYSPAFKMKIMEEIRDGRWKSGSRAAKMYGIKDSLRRRNTGEGVVVYGESSWGYG